MSIAARLTVADPVARIGTEAEAGTELLAALRR